MAYATQDDLVPTRLTITELVQLTCDDDSKQVNPDVVSAVLDEASGLVDSYCRNRYVTPLQPSQDVKGKTIDIALYLLFKRRRNAKMGEIVRQSYEDAIAFLKAVAGAKASLDQPVNSVTPQVSAAGPKISQRDRRLRFSDRETGGYV